MRKLPPKSTGSFDKLETANIVPRRDSDNTADDRIVIGGKAGDIVTFKAGTIVEGLEQATTGNAPDLSAYPTKEEMELALADKEDASVGDTHALKTDVESLDAEDIKAVPSGMHSDYYPSATGDSNKDIEMSSDIQNVGDAIAYNLELTRLLANRTNDVINNATSTNFVSLDTGTWPQSLKTSFAESSPKLSDYNQTQMNSFLSLELENKVKKKGGDSMEGPLVMQAQDGADGRATNKVKTLGVFSNSDGSALRLGTTRDRVYVGHNDTSFNGPIKVDEIQEKNTGKGVEFADRVILKTEGVEDDEAVTKKYIDDAARLLQNEIVELEEEIDALAPTMERGSWRFNPVGSANTAMFAMYAAGTTTSEYPQADQVFINTVDSDGTLHNFSDVEPGNYLEIFSPDDGDYGLYKVISKSDETSGANSFWMFDIEHSRSNRPMADAGLDAKCRIKFFSIADSVEATSFVIKSGDTMSGNLNIDKSENSTDVEAELKLKGNRPSTANSAATITFDNQQSTEKGYLTYRAYGAGTWFAFNQDVDLNNNGLHSVGQIRMKPDGGIGSGNNTRLTFHNASSGNEGEGLLVVPRPSDNRRGFVIRGKNADGVEQDLLYTYTNYSGTPDAINYHGKIDSGFNLVNKKYVDDSVASASSSSSRSPVMLHSGWDNKYSYMNPGSLTDAGITSDSLQASGNVIYLYRAYNYKGGSTMVVYHEATADSMIEIWEYKSVGEPMLIVKAGIREISTSPYSTSDAKLLLSRFWSKPDYNFSTSKKYTFMIRGLVESPGRQGTTFDLANDEERKIKNKKR